MAGIKPSGRWKGLQRVGEGFRGKHLGVSARFAPRRQAEVPGAEDAGVGAEQADSRAGTAGRLPREGHGRSGNHSGAARLVLDVVNTPGGQQIFLDVGITLLLRVEARALATATPRPFRRSCGPFDSRADLDPVVCLGRTTSSG